MTRGSIDRTLRTRLRAAAASSFRLALALCLALSATAVVFSDAPAEAAPPADCGWEGSIAWTYQASPEGQTASMMATFTTDGAINESGHCASDWEHSYRLVTPGACSTFSATGGGKGLATTAPQLLPLDDRFYFAVSANGPVGPGLISEGTHVHGCPPSPPETDPFYAQASALADGCADPYFVPETIQAVAGTCDMRGGRADIDVDSSVFRFRRLPCDQTVDSDGGGVSDCEEYDQYTDPLSAADDAMPDRDGDGIVDVDDRCPEQPGPRETWGCPDVDSDGDGFLDSVDDCISIAGVASAGGCPDADGDGVSDYLEDNCPGVANATQADLDGDRAGDACDLDIDGDGISNVEEVRRGTDPRDPDSDDDGVRDLVDVCPVQPGLPSLQGCPANGLVSLSGGYVYAGGLTPAAATATGVTTVLVQGPAELLSGAQVCIDATWKASVEQRIATSVPILWNGQVIPFEDSRLSGERSKTRKSFFTRKLTETVNYRECVVGVTAQFGAFPNSPALFVTSPNAITGLAYSASVSAVLANGTELKLKLRSATDKKGRIDWSDAKLKEFFVS